ncbi:MAG TPA: serine hydrolase [Solirubrobacteraceae bacterium]|nr:serine hydrolase [Solirubrobacteraceae bacterium]
MRADIDRIWSSSLADFDAAWELTLAGQSLSVRDPQRLFSGASMIKTLLAALLDEDVRAGALSLSRSVPVAAHDRVEGDGVLRFGQVPTMHRLGDLLLLMIAVSDNFATQALIAFMGGPASINGRLAARGYTSRLYGFWTTPEERLSDVSLRDHQAALASIAHPLIRRAFAAQQDRRSLARRVDYDAEFLHKTGTAATVRHDAGALSTPRGVLWVGAFTDGGPAAEWVDHPACVAMGSALHETLVALGLAQLAAP